jgi:hypothetical protein
MRLLTRLSVTLGRSPAPVVLATATAVGIWTVGLLQVESTTSGIAVRHPDNPIRRADEVLRQTFHGTLPLSVVAAGTTPARITDPVRMEQLGRFQVVCPRFLSGAVRPSPTQAPVPSQPLKDRVP